MPRLIPRLMVLLVAAAVVAGCSKGGPPSAPTSAPGSLTVTDVTVGRNVNPDKTIADKTDSFHPQDTFYVSVKTEGSAPSASLQARWSYEKGQSVGESTETIAPTGSAVTEFHINKPNGWPVGGYKVEVLLNGASVGTHEFKVE